MGEKRKCPEFDCGLKLTRQELMAHLQWDHNRSEREAEEMLEQQEE